MKIFKTIQLLLVLLIFCRTTVAQPPTLPGYTLQTFGAADGLLSSEILSLYQDKKDFIWIGTRSGISRYDSRRFQNFEYINNNQVGAVNSMAEDNIGTLWISTETGLYYWEGEAFVHYFFKDEKSYLPFTAIHFTSKSDVWIGTVKGPAHLPSLHSGETQELSRFLLPTWNSIAIDDGSVTSIHSSAKGVVIGATQMVYLYQNNRLQRLPNPIDGRESLHRVFIDDEGIIYWNNMLSGFHYWNGKQTVNTASQDAFYFDIFSKQGALYLYTNAGIKEVDKKTKSTTTLVNIEPLELSTPTCLLLDKEGAWWAGTTDGIFHIKKNEFRVHHDTHLQYSDVYSLLRRRSGELLIGANRGKIFLVKDSLIPYSKLPQVVPLAEVFSLYEDEDKSLWAATGYQGIAYYNKGHLKNFTTKNGLPDNTHYAFFKSSKGELWTAGDNGLTRIIKHAADSISFQPYFYLNHTGYHKIYGMVQAPDGSLWAGGQLGLFHLTNDSLQLYSLPEMGGQKLSVTAIKMDGQKSVWLSTRGHGILLCRFGSDNRLHLKQSWKVADGAQANTYLGLAFDEKDNVWAGSYRGVTAIISSRNKAYRIVNFDVKDGFINKSYQSLNMYADGETIWACTTAGAISFRPAPLLLKPREAQLYITSIDLLNTKKEAEEFLVKDKDDSSKSYQFPNNANSFSIQFAALYYTNPEAVRYYYQLQGVDSNWTSTGSERTILFRQLPAGAYKLLVKASIGGSDWTNTATLLFEIEKPWYLQWWVMASAGLISAAIILGYIKSREKKLKHQEQQKTELEKLKSNSYQHQLEIEQVVNYFATSLNGHKTIDGVLWDVARNCISRLGFEDCVIYLKNEEGNKLIQKAAWGPKTTEENRIVNPIEIPLGKGIVGAVALSGKAERLDDTSKDSRYIVDDAARASEISVPIFDEGEVIGVIDSEHSQTGFYTDRHLHILTTISSHCGAKISTLKAEAKTASARMESLLNKQKALEASLQSMRLQMNPHFLFNALNSIQQMILSGDETTATRFLSKFSKLLRTVLTNSDKEEISLKEEMELLQLYVELESLRFKESFHFSIDCDEAIDAEEVLVPALFFQPMVENAIWHGLMHKEGARKLSIRFEEAGESCLLCTIEDNGVGRQSSYKNGREQVHTGKGLSVAMERLHTLNEKNNTENSMQVIDKKDAAGAAEGTRIEITIYHQ